ncbi:MAG: PQQ-binding-like beta-propeller repeat protein [Pirellulales bacterium]
MFNLFASLRPSILGVFGLAMASPCMAIENDWTRFRGPNGSGVAAQSTVPLPWAPNQVRWKVELPGEGNGSAVVWNDHYFLMSADPATAERHVLCGNIKSGKVVWKKSFPSKPHPLHKRSSYASSTPCVDDKLVYFTWADPDNVFVKAFSHDGEEKWHREMGRYVSQHGFGTSPIRVNDLLVFANSQDIEELPAGVEPGEDHLVALEAATGKTRWQSERKASRVCYGVPCVTQDEKGNTILLSANTVEGFYAVDAASGKTLWSRSGFSKRVCSSAVLSGNILLSSEGSGGGGNVLFATEAKPNGKELFRINKAAPYVPTPVILGSLAFLWADNGIVSCIDLDKQGQVLWTQRIGGDVSASPVVVRDRLIGISQEGLVTILAASDKFEKLGEINLEETCRSTPAVTKDALLIRTNKHLICIGQ